MQKTLMITWFLVGIVVGSISTKSVNAYRDQAWTVHDVDAVIELLRDIRRNTE